jgi:hypothetical protein
MIKYRNLDDTLKTRINSGSWNTGWHGGVTGGLGGFLYVDPTSGGAHGDGSSWDEPLSSLTNALATMKKWDTIFCAPGNYTGNYATQANADAPFGAIIGMRQTSLGVACWAGATVSSDPILSIRARGWRVSGFEFDNPATDAGILLEKSADGSTRRPDYAEIDHCLFTGGDSGIAQLRGSTYVHIHNCRFDGLANSTANMSGAIQMQSTSHQLPIYWLVENNIFLNNIWHINLGASWGFNASVIKGNVFSLLGQARNALVLLDIRGGAGNQVVDNYFGCTVAQYKDDSSTAFVRANATDEGMGNMCNDGVADGDISA